MKKSYYIWMFIIVMLLTVTLTRGKELNNKLMGKVIVLDAGHGGKDKGTMVNGVYESELNLEIVLMLRDELIKQGVDVILTRDGDYDLSSPDIERRKKSDFDNRIRLINDSKADLYLSIHMNYLNDSRYYGGQVFYVKDNERLANIMQDKFNSRLGSPRNSKVLGESIYMYKQLEVPGVLIECGFLSNSKDRNKLVDSGYQEEIVETIIMGLIEYY